MMNLNIKSILSIAVLFALFSCNEDEKQTVITKSNLVLQDEFDVDGAPNSTLWNFNIGKGPNGDGWGNNELQYYTDKRKENGRVENGVLIIEARKEDYEGTK